MEFGDVKHFFQSNHRGVINTFRNDGTAQTSIVVCGASPFDGDDAPIFVTVRGTSYKVRNLRRNPRCNVMAVAEDWRQFAVVEGIATLTDYHNTEAEDMRVRLRDAFMACGDNEHPNWEEYDQAMVAQDAVIVVVQPQRVYGLIR
jgi:PPOX class probable F420-dependent enzyme